MTVRLEPLRRKDLARCAELERVLYKDDDPWSEPTFRSELDAGYYYLGAYVDGQGLVGYAGLSVAGTRGDVEANVHNIGVDPAWQRRGIGRALLNALLAKADEVCAPVYLEVRTDNDRAITLYEAHGFDRIGLRRKYYQPSGADAYTMVRAPGARGRAGGPPEEPAYPEANRQATPRENPPSPSVGVDTVRPARIPDEEPA